MFLWLLSQPIYRRATNFFELILYPATLLKVSISCRNSLVEFFRSLMYTITSSTNSESLTSSFPICISLMSFCCLTKILSTILNSYGESGQSCLVPDFSEITLSSSPFNLMLVNGLLYIAFIMFRYIPCISDLSKTLIMNGCWIFVKGFFSI